MSLIIGPMVNELETLIYNTWQLSGTTEPIFRSQQSERINWRALVQQYQQTGIGLILPYHVIDVGPLIPAREWSAMDGEAWLVDVRIYRVTSNRDEDFTAVEQDGEALRDALKRGSVHTTFQVMDDAQMDSSPENPANQTILEANYPMWAVEVSFQALIGYD